MNPISNLSQPHRKYLIPAGLTLISVALVSIAYIGYRAYMAKQTKAKINARPQPAQDKIAAYKAKIEQKQNRSEEYKELLSTTFPSLHNLGDRTSVELNATLKLLPIKNDYTHGKLTHTDLIDKLRSIERELHVDLMQEAARKEARENRPQELNAEKEKADAEKLQTSVMGFDCLYFRADQVIDCSIFCDSIAVGAMDKQKRVQDSTLDA